MIELWNSLDLPQKALLLTLLAGCAFVLVGLGEQKKGNMKGRYKVAIALAGAAGFCGMAGQETAACVGFVLAALIATMG